MDHFVALIKTLTVMMAVGALFMVIAIADYIMLGRISRSSIRGAAGALEESKGRRLYDTIKAPCKRMVIAGFLGALLLGTGYAIGYGTAMVHTTWRIHTEVYKAALHFLNMIPLLGDMVADRGASEIADLAVDTTLVAPIFRGLTFLYVVAALSILAALVLSVTRWPDRDRSPL